MLKLYTKTGDEGVTSLGGNKRIKKYSDVIELYGVVDELNAFLSYSAESLHRDKVFDGLFKKINRVQRELFDLSAHISTGQKLVFSPHKITKLELEIDEMSERLPVLSSFILPSGGECAVRLHLARTVCRRAERVAFRLMDSKKVGDIKILAVYLNRLSDWLYVTARTAAMLVNTEETLIK